MPDYAGFGTDHDYPAYLLPNDESENDRQDMLHELHLQILDGKLYLAPIKEPQRVIDLGTGTGIWAIDFGMFICWTRSIQNTMPDADPLQRIYIPKPRCVKG